MSGLEEEEEYFFYSEDGMTPFLVPFLFGYGGATVCRFDYIYNNSVPIVSIPCRGITPYYLTNTPINPMSLKYYVHGGGLFSVDVPANFTVIGVRL